MTNDLEQQAVRMKSIANELDQAMRHAEIAADHFASSEVPRGCAHTLAVQGHLVVVNEILNEIAKLHKNKAGL